MPTSVRDCIWCKVQIAGQESETDWPMPGIGSMSVLDVKSLPLLCFLLRGFTFRPGCCPPSLAYVQFSFVCKCNVGVPVAALCFTAMTVSAWNAPLTF